MDITEMYNIMLTANQQAALNDSETQDYEVAELKTLLNQARKEILLSNRWQFNTHLQTFQKDANNEIRIPTSTVLRFEIPNNLRGQVVERQRGEPLWDRVNNVAWTQDIQLLIATLTDYPYLPEKVAQWIAWRAGELLSFKLNGPDPTVAYIREQVMDMRAAALNSESTFIDTAMDFTNVAASAYQSYQGY